MTQFASLNDFADAEDMLVSIRHHLHQNPELSNEEEKTAAFVAEKLEAWGYDVTRGVGGHGVVGVLRAGQGNRSLAIRADMDALPIAEDTGKPYASHVRGVMHACGHDGHTTMLLGAAQYLAKTRNFSGTLNLVFQPAEEAGGHSGACAMIADGLFERFPCDAIFGLHNHPGAPAGTALMREGPLMAAADSATITVHGKGGHASRPHLCIDPIVVISSIVLALQTVVSRSVDSTQTAVVTVGTINGGTATNVIGESAEISVSIRTFTPQVRDLIKARIETIAQTQAATWGATASVTFDSGHPPVVNSAEETAFATEVLRELLPEERVLECPLIPGSEDFAHYLAHKPGCFVRLGNGEESAGLHNPKYDFNDGSLTTGAALWARIAERYLT
ncbi:hippurate hydrolase [Monaibacterium marinum]|uniref:Hippurate hydrolase n=1 Tax=Pontivivens marinum TaxID=1690039 RepID=A0A2C9CU33_9RHOB|nr:M20 aminoacylase family protein [Monaibacterium marinum]SOH93899.1 hippurate hydrolase [Monaibacterium marinum]